jgi:hypothetical protein
MAIAVKCLKRDSCSYPKCHCTRKALGPNTAWFKALDMCKGEGTIIPKLGLPDSDEERKKIPLDAIFRFWPDAMIALAKHLYFGNEKYNEGRLPVEWKRELSSDHQGSSMRHKLDRQKAENMDDVIKAQTAIVWRELAQLQLDIEARAEGKFEK